MQNKPKPARLQMTVFEIEIMLNYFYSTCDYRNGDFSEPAVAESLNWLCEVGMLKQNVPCNDYVHYSITEKGGFYVLFLQKVPLPETCYEIKMEF